MMHARSGTYDASPERLEEIARELESELLPRYREQRGYKGFTLLVDRTSGRTIGTSYWDDEAALQEADQLGSEAQKRAAERGGASRPPVHESWEVLIDDIP